MARTLTASDRKVLIRLASSMPKGSSERRAILAGLSASTKSAGFPLLEKVQDKEHRLGTKAMLELGITRGQANSLLTSMASMRDYNRTLREGEEPLEGKSDWIDISMTDGLVRPLGRKVVGQFYDLVYGDRKRLAGLKKSASTGKLG